MTPRNITVVTTSYPITNDGSEAAGSFVSDFVQTLGKYAKVTVIAPGKGNKSRIDENGIRIATYRAPNRPLSVLNPYLPKDFVTTLLMLRNASKVLSQTISQKKPDHIFSLWVLPSGFLAMRAARRLGIPFSTWALGSDIWSLGKIPIVRTVLKKVLRTSQINFADGYQLKENVEKLSKTECHFLPSTRSFAIQGQKPLADHPPYRLAYLGRWHPNKGIDLLCDSLIALDHATWKRIKEIRIYGGGPMKTLVQDRVRKLITSGRPVTMGGFLSKTEAQNLFNWADFVLIPSRIESIPVIFSDAMKSKCPVICMPVGDLPRLIENYNVGTLSKKVSATAFADAISLTIKKCPNRYTNALESAAKGFDLERTVSIFIHFCG